MNISNRFKGLAEDFIVSVIVPSNNYEKVNMHILDNFINKKKTHGIYITINRPYKSILKLMKDKKINTKNISFIDCISKEIAKPRKNTNCIFVKSPGNLTEIAIALDKLFTHTKHGFILFDSLDTLLLYNSLEGVTRFVHFITGKMRIYGINGILLGLDEKTDKELMSGITHFTDRTIIIN